MPLPPSATLSIPKEEVDKEFSHTETTELIAILFRTLFGFLRIIKNL